MQSDQEALAAQWLGTSFGSVTLFFPEQWSKGSRTREPADLAWWSDSILLLFYLKRVEPKRTRLRNWQSTKKAIRVNLEQAKEGLRMWRNGYVIRGGNSFFEHCIPYSSSTRVAVISVVESDCSTGKHHASEERRLGVQCCCTLPLSVLQLLAAGGAGIADLLRIAELLKSTRFYWSDRELQQVVSHYMELAWHRSGCAAKWPSGPQDALFRRIGSSFYPDALGSIGARPEQSQFAGNRDHLLNYADLANELLLEEKLRLIRSMQDLQDRSDQLDRRGVVVGEVDARNVFIWSTTHAHPHEDSISLQADWLKKVAAAPKGGVSIMLDTATGMQIVAKFPGPPPAYLARRLDSFATQSPGQASPAQRALNFRSMQTSLLTRHWKPDWQILEEWYSDHGQ
jgi:hypothetical protein